VSDLDNIRGMLDKTGIPYTFGEFPHYFPDRTEWKREIEVVQSSDLTHIWFVFDWNGNFLEVEAVPFRE
jgi:hypothetical protein